MTDSALLYDGKLSLNSHDKFIDDKAVKLVGLIIKSCCKNFKNVFALRVTSGSLYLCIRSNLAVVVRCTSAVTFF